VHLAYIWIVSHLTAKNYRNLWKFDEVLTKTNLLSFFGGHGVQSALWMDHVTWTQAESK